MENKQIRAKNIAWLVEQYGGPTSFGRTVGREQVQVSQWLGGKPIGDRLARHIEAALKKPAGWLDQPQWERLLNPRDGVRTVSHSGRLDPAMVALTARALLVVLRRRDPGAELDLSHPEDAELFCEAYAEASAMPDSDDAAVALGAVVADLIQVRGERNGRGEGEPAGGADRAEARRSRSRG